MKINKNIILGTVVLMVLMAFAGSAQAATITVDDDAPADFATILAALDAASDGDTITVAAGTYTENVAVNKQVTLLGANFDVDPAGSLDRGSESVIDGMVKIIADDITVNGFKLTNSYIEISNAYNNALNVDISYNILENSNWAEGAIDLNGGNRCNGGYIGYNTISGASGYGIQTIQNDDVTIEYNHVLNSLGFAAIDTGYSSGMGIVIHGNTITNSGGKGINYWAENGGVITDNVITNSNYEAIYTDAQATISGNQISGGNMYGILVAGGSAGSTVSGNTISNTNWEGIQSDVSVTITYNDISGGYNGIQLSNTASGSVIDGNNIHDNRFWGLSILDSVTDVIVTNNQLANNPYCGVIVWGDGDGSGIHINCNEITGNGIYGVESKRTTSDVDAENNWWGDVSGPYHLTSNPSGTGDSVSDNVDFVPWITMMMYSGATIFPNTENVILQATFTNSISPYIGNVDFYINAEYVGTVTVTSSSNGVAMLDLGTMPVGVYEIHAVSGCMETSALIAVYDPSAGFVTGGGWIDSPQGAYVADDTLSGKANFGFVSKYKKGAETPEGTTQFQFKVADLKFHSENYDWLVIAGEHAKYKGTGTINDEGGFSFMLTATDGDFLGAVGSDEFRIKIWDTATETVVYDNKPECDDTVYDGTELGGGSIVIHKAK